MKKFAVAAMLVVYAAGASHAGGMNEPIMEPVMTPAVVEEQSGSSGGFVLPLMVLAIIAAIVTSD